MHNTLVSVTCRGLKHGLQPSLKQLVKGLKPQSRMIPTVWHACRSSSSRPTSSLFVKKDHILSNLALQSSTVRDSSTSAAASTPVYELRTYRFTFTEFKKTLALFEKYIHLRINHSELIGFWTAEVGESIHEFVHIWKYDSLSHRAKVRLGLLHDEEWQTSFMANMVPGVQYMKNDLIAPVPGTHLNLDVSSGDGVYTLERASASSPPALSDEDTQKLLGRFLGIFGQTGIEYRLWRYPDVDAATAWSWKHVTESSGNISNVLLYPTKFSPLK